MFTNVIKSLPIHRLCALIERRPSPTGANTDIYGSYDEIEHYIVGTKSGALIDIQPQTGICRTIISNSYSGGTDNYYPIACYAWKGNKFIVQDGEENRNTPNITVYDPVTGEKEFIELGDKLGRYGLYSSAGSTQPIFRALISTDGNLFGANMRHRAASSTFYYNSETNQLEFTKRDSLPSVARVHGLRDTVGIHIENTAGVFDGNYLNYWWADDGTALFSLLVTECEAAGIIVKGNNKMFIHDDDRTVSSSTRRVIGSFQIGGVKAWWMIDIKNTSVYNRAYYSGGGIVVPSDGNDIYSGVTSYVWKTQGNITVSNTGWTKASALSSPFSTGTTPPKPVYDMGIMYSNAITVGRFGYVVGYVANKTYNFALPVALQDYSTFKKGDIIIPSNWATVDLTSSFYALGDLKVYTCNFGGLYGFSSDDEYVGFFTNQDGVYGFLRPDDLTFTVYSPTLNANKFVNGGYVKRGPITLNAGEFGCWWDDVTTVTGTTEINGDEYYYDNVFNRMNSVLLKDPTLNVYQAEDVCDVAFTVIPHKDKPWQRYSMGVANVPTTNGNILNVTEMAEDDLMFAGVAYSGLVRRHREANNTLTSVQNWGDVISFKGSLKISDTKILYYGYMASMDYIDLGADASYKISLAAVVPEINWASLYNNTTAIISGNFVRRANYIGGYGGFGYFNISTRTTHAFPNIPLDVRLNTAENLRRNADLIASTYSDADTETAFAAYITANSLSRSAGISNFINTAKYSVNGSACYDTRIIAALQWDGISGLKGIRINGNADGSGLWYTDNASPGSKVGTADTDQYAKILYINKADQNLATLQSSDYKYVSFTELLNTTIVGRPCASTNYIAFLTHVHSSSKAVVRVVLKSDIETAANGTGNCLLTRSIDIPLSSNLTTYGFGSQGAGLSFFSVSGTPRTSYFCIGDYLFVTISTNAVVPSTSYYPAVIRVNLVDGTYVVWCMDTVKQAAKGITYNPTTDTAYFSRDVSAFRITNFSSLTAPYLLT